MASHSIELAESDQRMPSGLRSLGGKLAGLGVLLTAAGVGLAYATGGFKFFQFSYLTAYAFALTVTMGGLVFLLIQHVFRASWSVAVRRIAESMVRLMPIVALLFLPVLLPVLFARESMYHVFEWMDPAFVQADAEFMPSKQVVYEHYLNPNFFVVRIVGYFVIWMLLARFFTRNSSRQDESGDLKLTRRMEIFAAPSIPIFALTLTFFGFDVIMSLDPHWFSTIFGVYLFAGGLMSFMSLLALLCMTYQRNGALKTVIRPDHYHDIGKLMFAFIVFWSYIAFSQYILIWYAHVPEEITFYFKRQNNGWEWLSVTLIFGHFVVPFLGILSKHVKRHKPALAFWAVWLLVMHLLDIFWLVMPNYEPYGSVPAPWAVLLMAPGLLVLLAGLGILSASSRSIVALRDPRLGDSLAYHNV
ncbi:MAG: quinol:cytochrome C oxidoreductase [Planctomycetota bacterium]